MRGRSGLPKQRNGTKPKGKLVGAKTTLRVVFVYVVVCVIAVSHYFRKSFHVFVGNSYKVKTYKNHNLIDDALSSSLAFLQVNHLSYGGRKVDLTCFNDFCFLFLLPHSINACDYIFALHASHVNMCMCQCVVVVVCFHFSVYACTC